MRRFLSLCFTLSMLTGCVADATAPTTTDPVSPEIQPETETVLRYTLNGENPPIIEEFQVPRAIMRNVPRASEPGAMTTMSLTIDPCTYISGYWGTLPDQYKTDLIIYHDEVFAGKLICVRGTGTLDLTTTYYGSTFSCNFAPDPAACVANLRVSGNVRSLWDGNTSSTGCYFRVPASVPGFPDPYYYFRTYPYATFGDSHAASYLANAYSLTCY